MRNIWAGQGTMTIGVAFAGALLRLAGPIDSAPVPVARSVVVDLQDLKVGGEPRCGMTLRYRGKVDQPITYVGARCSALQLEWVTPGMLGRRVTARLSPETRRDLLRAPDERTLLLSTRAGAGRSPAQLFPINSADRVYRMIVPK